MGNEPQNGPPDPAAAAPPPVATEIPTTGHSSSAPHRHRFLIGAAFTLATIIGVLAVLAVWVNRQALNTENWTNTSSQLLADKKIQTAVSAYAVDQLFKSGNPQAEIKAVLPTQLQPLAGPLSAGLEQVAGQVAPRLLASPAAQTAWRVANHAAHATFLKIVNGGGPRVSTTGGVVTLNLHTIVAELAASLGVEQQVAALQSKLQANSGKVTGAANQLGITLPPSDGKLVIMRSNQLGTVQDIAGAIKGLALLLPLLTFALFIVAVGLSRGHRQQALRTTGWCFAGIGLVALLARHVLGNVIVDALVKNPENKPAVHDVWTIGTTLLYDIAAALVVYGLVLVAAAWLGGRTGPARAARRALAPSLRTHPVTAYITVYAGLLLVVIWGPTPATRQIAYIAGFVVLLALGMHVLRRQTVAEFPDAQAGDSMRMLRAWNADRRPSHRSDVVSAPSTADGGHIAELERLAGLHDRGALTDAEFVSEKAALTNGS